MSGEVKILSAARAIPCPFCGSRAEIQKWHGGGPNKRMVSCSDESEDGCLVGPCVTGETYAEALENWNRRDARAGLRALDIALVGI